VDLILMNNAESESKVGVIFQQATIDDLPLLAKIHKAAYSSRHFTSLLSEPVLMKYYGYFLSDETSIVLAIEESSGPGGLGTLTKDVLGFAVYGVAIPEKIAAFKRDYVTEILLTSMRHPIRALGKIITSAVVRLRKNPSAYLPCDFLLLSIAVAVSGRSVGSALLGQMLQAAKHKDFSAVGLYVNADNIRAINVYFAHGFRIKSFNSGQYYMERRQEGD
jgi:ribosomal protein S18 acetylase RimI-like enzyme